MDDARRSDQLIRGIAPEVEFATGAAYIHGQGPSVYLAKDSLQPRLAEIQSYPSELGQLGEFPENDGRDTPAVVGKKPLLRRLQLPFQGVDEDVGIKIQHPT